ncbi:MAG: tRNA (adenosine(37)-N6)-threonylcarbamoyltransferase complex transferase subunit TsaD [Chloroflexi bacterium]|jgi:N6-L-threonylcarbamoyladenine synthase|nr:tRNA (adenosine(37)-N6)-threonylcarbamoyltransferase complex transferase subunit TsaD [Chloroflexota bacterium]MBK6712392.1 tRNA (adenosine(37)-N6)-threonylcarbamoyltransferase complex transferase subunit TsaD [Chloroflexota bacterium]MBK7179013.1 tRNA (adenosine(37)-N6)-threonylcarbamoyltransferase complex transferase subunit TsaD [Chloroflexota bacterium]MBK8933643.1 tRNA (adenosine(37)-N6)-threonylcarbamoyltransferase complex transferase subunit TsaD [Chloroflexota bacterium]MBP6803990.1 
MNQTTRILAIETSCDETAAAVIENGTTILSNVIASQIDLHAQYGGVFPEVASRRHIEVIHPVVMQAMNEAHMGFDDLDCLAVTQGPGLVGSLLVGVNMAKGIALGRNKPLLGINHIEGHIYSLWLSRKAAEIQFPILTLVVSGGHTELYLMTDHGRYKHLGGTLDDAAGEAFDKVGRVLGLPFPGGPAIDKAARLGNPNAYQFPRAIMEDAFNFSFSGLKTAVLRETQKHPGSMRLNDLAASFQAAVIDVLVTKTERAAAAHGVTAVHLAGGVSANSGLRQAMSEKITAPVFYPPPILCTDNAAMIGAAAHWHYVNGRRDSLDIDVIPSLQLA